ncbi:hypothetical protein CN157_25985 [Sinorhizobium meliloti]|uniref:hypothetical protein n=1 Tax=Rhizobium meliloti TaxID=382 RepID=UPI000425B0D5|nr:hypothetical protein [Sinorhizobium meliloti]MDE3829512.1 hypothetical protein [Sinorhizobium meliloti]MDE4577600.1 hypothetical protein [Sinorhizobium meliloti]MDW9780994.1 hypothetical protein [Sinorhizobium meliloti]RVK70277.1 hypothetical protein CN157_25985 [Sinorhizobium meliloti]RVL09133.1 hypothetical protein CN149_26415 [Sinorhizobium meliloti]
MRFIVLAAALLASGAAYAQETKHGWGFQFRQDTFDKVVFPLSMMSEEGDSFDKATLAVACGPNGKLVAFFQPSGFVSFDSSAKLQLRDGNGTKEFTFSVGEVPHLAKRLMIDAGETEKLIDVFARADGQDVPFRSGEKQGAFSSIAARATYDLLRQNCPN